MKEPNAVLGNNKLTIVLDEFANILHLYYPHVGMWQHMFHSRCGVFAQGVFKWLPPYGSGVHSSQNHLENTLGISTTHSFDGITLRFTDVIHPQRDVFIRRITLENARDTLKLFFYNRLNIAESEGGETVFYDDETKALIHFKGNQFILFGSYPTFSSFVCGEHTVRGLSGSYVDAEDGKLVKNEISQGLADSTSELTFEPVNGRAEAYYYIATGSSLDEVVSLNNYLVSKKFEKAMHEAMSFWSSWIAHKPLPDSDLSENAKRLYKLSMYVLQNSVDHEGAIIASFDSRSAKIAGNSYNYCWWRDACYVSMALNEVGMSNLSLKFLNFAALNQRPEGYFYHRHRADGSWGSTWHKKPFVQLDQTASVISAVYNYYVNTNDVGSVLDFWPMVKSAAGFLISMINDGFLKPSYDMWEEEFGVHVYTAAAVWHGLMAAELVGDVLGKERRGWSEAAGAIKRTILERYSNGEFVRALDHEDKRADSSMLMLINLGLLEPSSAVAQKLVHHVEKTLSKPTGGISRYQGDQYCGYENPWIISTLWLAQAKMLLGDFLSARQIIEWVAHRSSNTGLLPEQVHPETGRSTSVTPLTWSHATYVTTVNMYSSRLRKGGYTLRRNGI